MKAADWMDAEGYRNRIIAELFDYCVEHGLNASAKEHEIIIELPSVGEINVWPEVKKRKVFDISKWGPVGIDEATGALPDDFQLPETGEILDEGQPPKGDPDAEK